MTAPPQDRTCEIRPLDPGDWAAMHALIRAAPGAATYVGNDLEGNAKRHLARRALGVFQRARLAALCWFGGRANLMIVAAPGVRVDADQLTLALRAHGEYWRIALGPREVLGVLAAGDVEKTRILRTQIFCEAEREAQVVEQARPMRLAARTDLDWLVAAAVELNRSDLGLRPDEVGERWIRDAARARLRAGTTFVVGAPGAPIAKLDLGSTGAAGSVIEGVFTEPRARGQGVAAGLVAAVCARELRAGARRVALHVDCDNAPARACYARAGMREACESGLLLRDA